MREAMGEQEEARSAVLRTGAMQAPFTQVISVVRSHVGDACTDPEFCDVSRRGFVYLLSLAYSKVRFLEVSSNVRKKSA